MSCFHTLPSAEEIDAEVVGVSSYGKYADSIGSPQVEFSFECPDCGEEVSMEKYANLRRKHERGDERE